MHGYGTKAMHYGMVVMHVTLWHYINVCMVPMHVTLQNGTMYTNAYLTTECMVLSMYVTLRIYGMVPMHVIYGMVPMVTLYDMVPIHVTL